MVYVQYVWKQSLGHLSEKDCDMVMTCIYRQIYLDDNQLTSIPADAFKKNDKLG